MFDLLRARATVRRRIATIATGLGRAGAGLVLLLAGTAAHAQGLTPEATVEEATKVLQAALDGSRQFVDSDPERFQGAIDGALAQFVDYPGIAKGVMARHWAAASPAQRDRFATVFRTSLVRTYGRALVDFDQQSIRVLPARDPRRDARRATVRMEVVATDGTVYPMDYTMVAIDGAWKMRNLVVNGVNLGLTYRNQFGSSMQAPGASMDAVIDGWSPEVDTGGAKDTGSPAP